MTIKNIEVEYQTTYKMVLAGHRLLNNGTSAIYTQHFEFVKQLDELEFEIVATLGAERARQLRDEVDALY